MQGKAGRQKNYRPPPRQNAGVSSDKVGLNQESPVERGHVEELPPIVHQEEVVEVEKSSLELDNKDDGDDEKSTDEDE